ncbi:hypothetical protein NKJ13_29655 [Mesorhizobium sp. M0174]
MPTLIERPPHGDAWIQEVEFDGYGAGVDQKLGNRADRHVGNAEPLLDIT